ncbi:MAG: neutral ceramidase, partial [Solirubrobacteraceae bacterium]|nr:neutral ceramidase [Solirubrobacteraceae bacterium]
FSPQNVLVSATHTHASPTGFMNFSAYNSVLPTKEQPTGGNVSDTNAEPKLYSFMVRRLALALKRAEDDLAPGVVGWGNTQLLGVTQNRSLEAHLADFGIKEAYGTGSVGQDPLGYADTIDPNVDVLRVDKLVRGRHVPVGMWSDFANHGTTNPFTWSYYNADHQGTAERVAEAAVRRLGHVPRHQEVVNAFSNGDEGDMTSGLYKRGPAVAEYAGRSEASAMVNAWKIARRAMTRRPVLDWRWTRMCFCGQQTREGPVDTTPVIGMGAGGGSEEGRTVFTDATGINYEGRFLPIPVGPQGVKVPTLREQGSVPAAVPVGALRIADRMIATVPAEMTVGMGKRVKASVLAASQSAGIHQVVVSGLAGEYLSYLATPEEYDRQHYEGGFTLYGRTSSLLVQDTVDDLARRLASGQPSPAPYAFDPTNGTLPNAASYAAGPDTATSLRQPAGVARLERARFSWHGGADGIDRPLDTAFVTVSRQVRGRWKRYADDLGLTIAWSVSTDGTYVAQWEVPLSAPTGTYRFSVSANRYQLDSDSFHVDVSRALTLTPVSERRAVTIDYPAAAPDRDFTYRPASARGGSVRFTRAGHRAVVVRHRRGSVFDAPDEPQVTVAPGDAQDRYGNTNGREVALP